MSNIYRIGNRVKLVESDDRSKLGKTYTVITMQKTQCCIEDINGERIWVEYDCILPFIDDSSDQKTVEQYKSDIVCLVKMMNREHGMSVSALRVEAVQKGNCEDRDYIVKIEV